MTLGEWTGAVVEPSEGSAPPSPDEWRSVEVPGRPSRFAGADAVAYRTRFADPRTDDERRVVLELRGLFAHARIWLNGDLLGSHDVYFAPARFEVDPAAENELVVECRAPDDRFGGVYDTDLVPDAAAVPGIWWDAEVRTRPETFLSSLSVSPRLTDDRAVIDAELTVDAGRAVDDAVTFSLRPEGFRGGGTMERAGVTADAGERVTVEKAITVRDPTYWWPRGHGPQHRYAVRAKFGDAEATATTGLCTVDYGDDGLTVNGQRVPARGFNLLPTGDPAESVERAASANANLVRAHAHVPPRSLYDACDEAGVLVWQDLPLTGRGEYDRDRAATLADRMVARTARHPSVGAFGVHDDPVDPYADGIGPSRLARYRVRWRAWRTGYDSAADERVTDAFPDGAPVFPVAGQPGTDPDASHLYPGWSYGRAADVDWLLDRYPGIGDVVGEFGAGALGADGVDEAVGFDREKHDAYVSGDREASQSYQSRVLKTVAEALRRRETDVLAAFALRDADDAGMGVLTGDGEEKRGYAALAASFEPVQVLLAEYPTEGAVEATAVNDTPEPVSGTVSWEAGDHAGSADVSVEAFGREPVGVVDVPGDAATVEVALSLPDRTVSNSYSL